MKNIRVYVEGCLDASLVSVMSNLLENNYNLEVKFEIESLGEKSRVIHRLIDDLMRFRVIAFVDADRGVYDTIEYVEKCVKKRGLDVQLSLELEQYKPPHIDLYKGREYISSIILWAKPPGYQIGTIEDIVCSIFNDYCARIEEELEPIANTICRGYVSPRELGRWIKKISPLLCITLCLSKGTLVWDPTIKRCGFSIIEFLTRVVVKEKPQCILAYIDLLYNITSMI